MRARHKVRLWLYRVRAWVLNLLAPFEYHVWIWKSERLAISAFLEGMHRGVPHEHMSISVLSFASRSDERSVRALHRSLARQFGSDWDYCVVVDRVTPRRTVAYLTGCAQIDPRIRIRHYDRSLGWEAFAADIVDTCSGDFVLLLDAPGEFAHFAFAKLKAAMDQFPEADVFYFDEDVKAGTFGLRCNPWFKPGWSPELLLSINYMQPCLVRRTLLVDLVQSGLVRDGWNAWDVSCALGERSDQIIRIPSILFHRRQSREIGTNRQAPDRIRTGLAESIHHSASHSNSSISGQASIVGLQRRRKNSVGMVSIIVPTKDNPAMLANFIKSLRTKTSYTNYEILIIETGSVEVDAQYHDAHNVIEERIQLLTYQGAFNYSAVNNFGARQAAGELLLFMNDDMQIVESGWLTELVRCVEREGVGIVGAKLLFPQGSIQHAGIVIRMGGLAGHVFRGAEEHVQGVFGSAGWYRNYLAITGACMMIPRDIFEALGGFDEGYELAYSDVDLCLRARKLGLRVMYTPFARILHFEGSTRGRNSPAQDADKAKSDFAHWLAEGDPYYHPGLSEISTIPKLRLSHEERLNNAS